MIPLIGFSFTLNSIWKIYLHQPFPDICVLIVSFFLLFNSWFQRKSKQKQDHFYTDFIIKTMVFWTCFWTLYQSKTFYVLTHILVIRSTNILKWANSFFVLILFSKKQVILTMKTYKKTQQKQDWEEQERAAGLDGWIICVQTSGAETSPLKNSY